MRDGLNEVLRKPTAQRALIGVLVVIVFVTALVSFYLYASSPTDENIFVDTPSRLLLMRDIPAEPTDIPLAPGKFDAAVPGEAILRKGDLVWAIGETEVHDSLPQALLGSTADAMITVSIFRPTARRSFAYRVRGGAFEQGAVKAIPSAVAVTDVTPGGASDRAGIRIGDLIVRINGQEFKNAHGADLHLRRGQTGRAIMYDIYRDGEPLTVSVTLARFGFPLAALLFSITGILYILFGSFVALRRPYIVAARIVGLSFILLGFFLAVVAARRDTDVTAFVAFRYTLMTAGLFFGTALASIGTMLFPRERPEMIARPWIKRTLYALAAVGFVTILAVGIFQSLGILQPGGRWEQLTILGFIAAMVIFNIAIHIIFRKQRTREHRKLTRTISWTSGAVGLLVILVTVLEQGRRPGFIALFLLAIPLAYLYTIGRHRLLDMNLRIRRNIIYAVMTGLWGLFMAAVLVGSFFLLMGIPVHVPTVSVTGTSVEITEPAAGEDQEREPAERAVLMVLAVGAWYVLWRVRKRGQRLIDARFDRTAYDYRRAANELGEVMTAQVSMVDLGRGIARKLAELMRLKRAAVLFFRNEDVCCCEEAYGIQEEEWGRFCSVQDVALMRAVGAFSGEFRADYLAPELKESLRHFGFHQLVPVRSRDQLLGVFLLGEKLSEATYSQEDLAFLAAAARQASVAIENAFLYEEIAEKERMKHELAIARRIQMASLPQHTPQVAGLSIAAESLPALEVGGDFYDYLDGTGNGITVVVGDVSGKGTSAALYMSKIQGILRSLHGFEPSPGELLKRANRLLFRDMERKSFVTVIAASFNPGQHSVSFARAGHLPLYHWTAADRCIYRRVPGGLGLGLNDAGVFSSELREETLSYAPGDVMVFVTDGVTEARRNAEDEEFGERRLIEVIREESAGTAVSIRDAIVAAMRAYAGDAPPHDDATVVVVKAESNGAASLAS